MIRTITGARNKSPDQELPGTWKGVKPTVPKLICKRVIFYSRNDESAFIDWLSGIRGIKKWEGVRDEIHVYVPKSTISNTCLRELTALFFRYKIDMRQLQQFVNDNNRQWYARETAYWHRGVFGKKGTSSQ
jgi:hypothetical protein